SDARAVLGGFQRWPTWMWANEEMIDLLDWLRRYNAARSPETRIGFYGLDIYDLWDSLQSVLGYLRRFQPDAVDTALRALRCFEAYGEDPRAYASAMRFAPASCEEEVITLLQSLSQARAPAPSMPDD